MDFKRENYVKKLLSKRSNGFIKIITGMRRVGKSYLLDPLFKNALLSEGIKEDHIIKMSFDTIENSHFHKEPELLEKHLLSFIKDEEKYYLLLDEIQLVNNFEFLLNSLLYRRNIDVYVTGSNSKFLSSDIITEFRGRGQEIRVMPLTFKEIYDVKKGDPQKLLDEYLIFGGMPGIFLLEDEYEKYDFLKSLFDLVYTKDILNRYSLRRDITLDAILDILASSVGSLTNPNKLYETFKSNGSKDVSAITINSYINYIQDAFIISKANRYDIKGKKYISTPYKYYFSDLGLRNARLNGRQNEKTHLFENAIYIELISRGYNVDVGVVELREGDKRIQTEIDFVCNMNPNRYYIQSCYSFDEEKLLIEQRPLNNTNDNFKKIIISRYEGTYLTESGMLVVNIIDFLLNPDLEDILRK